MRKKKKHPQLERLLAEQIKTQVLLDHQDIYADPLLHNGPHVDQTYEHWLEEHHKTHHKIPSFLKPVVEEVIKELKQKPVFGYFEYSEELGRPTIEAMVFRRYEWAQLSPEEMENRTWEARENYARQEKNIAERMVEEAREWVQVIAVDLPKKEQLYPKGRIKHFADCMRELKKHGKYGYYASREACGKRLLESHEFWEREWFKQRPEAYARSYYELGPKFWIEAQNAHIDTQFLREWKEAERKDLERVEKANLQWAECYYFTGKAGETYKNLIRLSIKKGYSDNKIMKCLKEAGTTKLIDPSFLRSQIPELRKEVQKEYENRLDQEILWGILEGLPDKQIVKEIKPKWNIYEDELATRVRLVRKSMREELNAEEQKQWTKLKPILLTLRMKI